MTSSRHPLFKRLPRFEELSTSLILDRFLDYVAEKGQTLYPAQEEAILAIVEDQNVILNTPTGSGKSLVAAAMHFHSLSMGRRSIYTSPIKALVNEKFLALAKEFGPEQVGMSTGDGSVNSDAPILCCTAEILANMALREGENSKVDDIVMDEFHYYSDRERGSAWQIPLLTLRRARFMLMSATLGEMDFFKTELEKLTQKTTVIVSSQDRPVPLKFEYAETPIHETVKSLLERNAAPVYLVCFSQREAAEQAQALMSFDFLTKEQKREIQESLHGTDFSSPYGKEITKFIKHGIGIHHGGLLPKYRVLVEKLAQTGLLKIICGTDTLGVGVNIPIRTVLFTKLCKYDGTKTAILSVRDFHQISGRAGRKGFDDEGFVVCQAPEHVIENLRQDAKAKADPKKAKKFVKAKPPEKGFVMWTKETFEKLIKSKPEALVSRFQVTHGMMLNVLSRTDDDGCAAMRALIRASHERTHEKKKHFALAWELFRSLLNRQLLELVPSNGSRRHHVRVNLNLQEDFSLDSALSLYLIDTLALLDPQSETYALDVLTLVESTLENPEQVLRKQVDKLKTQLMFELKMAGVEYDQRMEELEKVEHPKPLRDFIYDTFNAFSDKHPWVGTENIRPKSVAREMYETFQSFTEYVREYELQRGEGILLRYITDVYRALSVTVPTQHKNEELDAITEYFGSIIQQIDSSLIDEWERIRNPDYVPKAKIDAPTRVANEDPFRDVKSTRIRALNEVFRAVRAFAMKDFEAMLEILQSWSPDGLPKDGTGEQWNEKRLELISKEYHESHGAIRTDPFARGTKNIRIRMEKDLWSIEHTLSDFDGHDDWQFAVSFSLTEGRALGGRLVMSLHAIQPC